MALSLESSLRRRVIVGGSSAGTGVFMMMVTGGSAGATKAGWAAGGFQAGAVSDVGGRASGRGCQTRLGFERALVGESPAWADAVIDAIKTANETRRTSKPRRDRSLAVRSVRSRPVRCRGFILRSIAFPACFGGEFILEVPGP